MSATVDQIRRRLEQAFHPAHLEIEDESWKHRGHAGVREHGGGHYVVSIVCDRFAGLPRSQCHRMIYRALDDLFPTRIHALTIRLQVQAQ